MCLYERAHVLLQPPRVLCQGCLRGLGESPELPRGACWPWTPYARTILHPPWVLPELACVDMANVPPRAACPGSEGDQ